MKQQQRCKRAFHVFFQHDIVVRLVIMFCNRFVFKYWITFVQLEAVKKCVCFSFRLRHFECVNRVFIFVEVKRCNERHRFLFVTRGCVCKKCGGSLFRVHLLLFRAEWLFLVCVSVCVVLWYFIKIMLLSQLLLSLSFLFLSLRLVCVCFFSSVHCTILDFSAFLSAENINY